MQQWQCCRTCLSVLNLSPIFVIPEHHDKYAQVVLEATGVKIDLNDSLPQQMCSECINFTNEAYRFRKKCQDVQKSLTGTLNHTTFYEIKIGVVLQPDKPHFIDISSLVDEYDNVTLSEYKLELHENNSADVNNSTDVNNCTDVNNSADVNNSTDVNNCTGVNNSADVNHLEEIILDKPIEKNHKKIRTKERSKPVKRTLRKRKNDKEKKEREKEEIECEYCHKILTSKLSLRNHYKIHTGFDVVCEHCGKKFITRRLLLMHCKAKHGYEKTDKCSFCDYRASNAEQVKIHERLHTGEKPYACAACGAVFHRKSSYLQHVAIHLPEKTVQCTQCPARFKSVTLMRIHANRHRATQYTYKCVICAHNFARRRNVARHLLRIHAVQPLAEHIERNKCV